MQNMPFLGLREVEWSNERIGIFILLFQLCQSCQNFLLHLYTPQYLEIGKERKKKGENEAAKYDDM
jgi:hypothetical protein